MSTNNKKHTKHPSAPVVSVGCSRLKSYLSLRRCHRPRPQQPQTPDSPPAVPPPELRTPNDSLAAQAYWKRACELERELSQLSTWMNSYLSERLKNTRTTARGDQESVREAELTRLGDGSYLREVKKVGRPWGRLVMQISAPTIAQNCCTATEVMREMASMGDEELRECLAQSMPMHDMAGCHRGLYEGTNVPPEDGFVEAVLLQTIERIEGLVMEGLKKQMGSCRRAAKGTAEKREKERREDCGDVVVMQIQVRDPEDGYGAIAEPMVGFVEVSAAEVEGGGGHRIRRVVVAGIKDLGTLEKF